MKSSATKTVNLALQGGGAHGAFTWGVLDRLLEEEALAFDGVAATSAGAMNAAALKTGLMRGGRDNARETLDDFWGSISRVSRGMPNPLLEWVKLFHPTTETLSAAIEAGAQWGLGDGLTNMFSPYDLNPFNFNPLRTLLEDRLDFGAVCREAPPHLFIGATNVRTGRAKVFSGNEISSDAILASTTLPSLFQAIEIPNPETGRPEAYWDGGFTGNPPLFPLFYGTRARDILIVHINPIEREELPRNARDIMNRVNEISFNASLMGELRAIAFTRRLIAEGRIPEGAMKDVLVHSIMDDATMRKLGGATKLSPDWTFLLHLKEAGREAADGFLRRHWSALGEKATVDLRAIYGG